MLFLSKVIYDNSKEKYNNYVEIIKYRLKYPNKDFIVQTKYKRSKFIFKVINLKRKPYSVDLNITNKYLIGYKKERNRITNIKPDKHETLSTPIFKIYKELDYINYLTVEWPHLKEGKNLYFTMEKELTKKNYTHTFEKSFRSFSTSYNRKEFPFSKKGTIVNASDGSCFSFSTEAGRDTCISFNLEISRGF